MDLTPDRGGKQPSLADGGRWLKLIASCCPSTDVALSGPVLTSIPEDPTSKGWGSHSRADSEGGLTRPQPSHARYVSGQRVHTG